VVQASRLHPDETVQARGPHHNKEIMSTPSFIDPELLRRISALELKAREVADGVLLGIHHDPHRGRSIEFAEHKEYSPGDDLRRIDWKLFGKSDRLYVKEYEDDANITAVMMVDGSRSMNYASAQAKGPDGERVPTKLETARLLSASLSYLLLNQSDSVGLGVFSGTLASYLPPRARKAHFHEITARLAGFEPQSGTDLAAALGELAGLIKGRAMIIIFSDLLDEPAAMMKAIRLLRHRRHELVVFHVLDPDELTFPFERLTVFRDLESPVKLLVDPRSIRAEYLRHFGRFQEEVMKECLGHGIDYRLARTDQSPAGLLSAWLSFRAAAQRSRGRG
jgi:uncharacterized protein (DUF58 family)